MNTKSNVKDKKQLGLSPYSELSDNERIIVEALVSNERASRLRSEFSRPGITHYVDGSQIMFQVGGYNDDVWFDAFRGELIKITVDRNFGRPTVNQSLLLQRSTIYAELAAIEANIKPQEAELARERANYEAIREAQDEANKKGEAISDAVTDNLLEAKNNIEAIEGVIASYKASIKHYNKQLEDVEKQLPEQPPIHDLIVIEIEA